MGEIRIYEVDHPATQAWKRERLAEAQIALPPWLILVPVDFERDDVGEKLVAAGFQQNSPAFFTWLGVVPYLTQDAIGRTLDYISSIPARWPASRWSTPSICRRFTTWSATAPPPPPISTTARAASSAPSRWSAARWSATTTSRPVLRQAVISIEDKSFESHWGINVFRVAGAVWHDIRSHGRAQGASTLTMQLARNLFLSSERTATRKIQEAYLAIQIERAFTKEQIFTLYGNQIYLGSGMYGFEAASEYYFSKHAKDLT
jgi:hypothetical protein